MRTMDCRNVRREIEAAGNSDLLGPAVHAHLQSCAACESLSRQQNNLQAILSSLETVEAPGDFGFRVRARLAAERQAASPTEFGNFSFGVRSAAVSMVLFLVAAAFVFVSFRSRVNPTVVPQEIASNPVPPSNNGVAATEKVVVPAPAKETAISGIESTAVASDRGSKGREGRAIKANRVGTRDFSSTQASVKHLDEGDSAAFPINASYQSLKVSVNDAHGSSRTISLPTVSFGSQRTLSQNAAPLMASARGVW